MLRSLLLLLPALFLGTAQATESRPIGMVTGPKSGTYISIGRDIAKAAQAEGVTVDIKESGGSIDNIKRITSGENAALGIVQSDVLNFLARSKNPDSIRIADTLRLVFPLYQEEVHVLASKDIKRFADLQGKRVVIGEESSGSMLTAINLFSIMGVVPSAMMKISPPEGVVAVLKKEADAMVFVGGKPVRVFRNLEELPKSDNKDYIAMLDSVHFLPLKEPRLLEEYKAAELTSADYRYVKEAVPTLAVTSALVAYDFSASGRQYSQERCDAVAGVARAVRKSIDKLRSEGHSKWQEVDLDAPLGSWKRDGCAWPEEKKPAADRNALDRDLLSIVGQGQ